MTMNGAWIIALFSLLFALRNCSCSTPVPCDTIDLLKLGCFAEKLANREFLVSAGDYNSSCLIPEHCVRLCGQLSFQYSALQNGETCLCGNAYGSHGAASTCNVNCTGDVRYSCGGKEANTVYNSTPFTGHFALNKPFLPLLLFNQASITAVYTNGTINDPGLSVDISEQTGYSNQQSISLEFNFKPTRWGRKRITAKNYVSGGLRPSSIDINVVSPVKYLTISCPNYVKTQSEFQCAVKVYQGTKMYAKWRLAKGSWGNISLADPAYLGVGPPIPQWTVPNIASHKSSGVFLIPSSLFIREAMVLGLEIYGNTSGNIKIFLARPVCTQVGQQYCINNSTCVSSDETCTLDTKQQCTAPQLLNISSSKCQNPAICSSSNLQSAVFQSSPSSVNYSVICDFGSIPIQIGYNLFVLPEEKACKAQKGDILGWVSEGSGQIGHRNASENVRKYATPSSYVNKGYNFTQADHYVEMLIEFMLRAVSAEGSIFLTRHMIEEPGVQYYHVNITNNVTSLPVERTREIRSQMPVTSIKADYPKGFNYFGAKVNDRIELVLNISTATNLTMIVANVSSGQRFYTFFKHDDQKNDFFLHKVNLTGFPQAGFFKLYAEASNEISSVNTTVNVLVGGEILGLNGSLSHPEKPVYQGLQTSLLATIVTGPQVRFKWIFESNHIVDFVNSNETAYAFRQVGVRNITIIGSNQAFTVSKSFTVVVVNPLSLSIPDWAVSNISVTLNCTLKGNFPPNQKYLWEFGDGSNTTGTNALSVQHTFAKGGKHNISCRVVNPAIILATSSIFILEAVAGQCLKPFVGVELFDNKTFIGVHSTGNNLTYSWVIQGDSISFLSVCNTKNFTYYFQIPGRYRITLNITNAISFLSCSKDFLVEEIISNVSITASPNPAPSNTTVRFEIVKGAGTNVSYHVDFGDGYFIRNFDGPRLEFNRTFTAGKRQITLTAANTVSKEIIFNNLTIQDVVKNLMIEVDADGRSEEKIFVAVNKPKELRCRAEKGTDLTFRWIITDKIDKVILSSGKPYVSTNETFNKEQDITINVTAFNLVSSTSQCIKLYAQKPIKGFNVDIPSCVASGEEFKISLGILEGGGVKYNISFGDGSPNIITTKSSIKKIYFANNNNTFRTTAFNHIGQFLITKSVSVQFRIKDLTCGTFNEVVAYGNKTNIFWKISNGSDVTYTVNFGDGLPEVNLNSQLLGQLITLNHTYSEAKQYEIVIKASNLLGQMTCVVKVTVEELITGLTIQEQVRKSVAIYEEVIIRVNVTQGSQVTYTFDFGDGSDPVSSVNGLATHVFSYEGNFKPNIRAKNLLDAKSVDGEEFIATAPKDPQRVRGLAISVAPTIYGSYSLIKITWTAGARFDCLLDLGEGPPKTLEYHKLGPPINYTYNEAHHFVVEVRCNNSMGEETAATEAKVEVPIVGLTFTNLNSSSYEIEREFGKIHNIQWTWVKGSFVKCSVRISKSGKYLNLVQNLKKSFELSPDILKEPGTYRIYLHASNAVTKEQTISLILTLIQRITHPQLLVNPYVQVEYPAMAFLTMKTGSHATSVWSYGKAGEKKVLKSNDNYIRFQHKFTKPGDYVINVTVWNRFSGNMNVSSKIAIVNPVVGFSMTPQHTLQWPANRVTFQFKRNQTLPPPSNASYRIEFGDNTPSEEMILDSKQTNFTFQHSYEQPDCYVAVLTIFNKASYVRLESHVSIIQKVESLTLEAFKYQQNPTRKISEKPEGEKHLTIFPLEYPVTFRAKHLNGTCTKYSWYFGDTETNLNETTTIINHLYPLPGNYSVRVLVSNSINIKNDSINVKMLRSVIGLYLISNSPTKPGRPVTFIIFCAQPGNNTRFVLETGENTNITNISYPKRGAGAEVIKMFSPKIQLPFDNASYYASIVNHTYEKQSNSVFEARVSAWNEASLKSAQTTVVVTDSDCSIPNIDLYGGGTTLEEALPFKYDRDFRISSRVNFSCSVPVKAMFQWSVFIADTYYKKNSSMPPDENLKISLPSHVNQNQSSIVVPKSTLMPGYYLIELRVKLLQVGLTNTAQQYVKISTPFVVAKIEGGSSLSRGWDAEVVLDASKSYDPLHSENEKLTFQWYCKQIKNSIEFGKGGCFGRGEGLVESVKRVFRIRRRSLLENVTYNFTVMVTPQDKLRAMSDTQLVKIVQGKPPDVNIECVYNCGGKVTSDERLAIKTYCSDCQKDTTLEYSWTAQKIVDGKRQAHELWPNDTLTIRNLKYAVVKENVLEQDTTYILKVEAKRKGGASAFAEYQFTTNSPPKNGHCIVSPMEGRELETNFYVTCGAWVEEDKPLTYEILLKNKDDQYTLMWYGPELSNSKVILTAGEKENNFTLDLIVRVRDVYGAVNESAFKIKVGQLRGEITSKRLLNFADNLDSILARGDVMGAFQLATVLASIINKQKNGNKTGHGGMTEEERKSVRSGLMVRMAGVVPRDIQAVRQLSGSLELVAQEPKELSLEAQNSSVFIYTRAVDVVLKSATSEQEPAQIEVATRGSLSAISSFIAASSMMSEKLFLDPKGNARDLDRAQTVANRLVDLTNKLANATLINKLPGEIKTQYQATYLHLAVEKVLSEDLGMSISAGGVARFVLPGKDEVLKGLSTLPEAVSLAISQMDVNPFSGTNSSLMIKSSPMSLTLMSKNSQLDIAGLSSYIDIFLQNKNPQEKKELNTSKTPQETGSMTIHNITLQRSENAIIADIIPDNRSASVNVYFRYNSPPTLKEYDVLETLPRYPVNESSNITSPGPYTFFASSDRTNGSGNYFIGVLPSDSQGNVTKATLNYTFDVFSSGCYFWSEEEKVWKSEGCRVGNETTRLMTHCQCTHLTWFGGDLFIPPNKLDLEQDITNLIHLDESPALIGAICFVGGMYLLALVFARRWDKKDTIKVGLIAVPDNDPTDRYRYEVTVYTGRMGRSTTSNISVILYGELAESHPINLMDKERQTFESGSVDSFFVTVSEALGPLNYIRIWHDNSGVWPAWYLNQVIIRDIDTDERFVFLCYRWLACDEDDGQVDRIIPTAGKEELREFTYLFRNRAKKDFSDAHLWFSIALRPPRSQFTRVQRVSCCLSLLLCTMLANVMWYDVQQKKNNTVIFKSGFIVITWQSVVIGVYSSLIVFPINLLIAQIFRNLERRPRKQKNHENEKKEQPNDCYNTTNKSVLKLNDIQAVTRSESIEPYPEKEIHQYKTYNFLNIKKQCYDAQESFDDDLLCLLMETRLLEEHQLRQVKDYSRNTPVQIGSLAALNGDTQQSFYQEDMRKKASISPVSECSLDFTDSSRLVKPETTKPPPMKINVPKFKFLLPWWFVFVAWFLCISTSCVAGIFTVVYGHKFERKKQEEWLFSMLVSIIQDIFISQPLKVIGFALFFALILKKPDKSDESINAELAKDEEWLKQNVGVRRRNALIAEQPKYMAPDEAMLKKARIRRFKERKMYSVIREIVMYAMFVWVVLLTAYGHKDPNAHVLNQGIENMLTGTGNSWLVDYTHKKLKNETRRKFLKVSGVRKFWEWTNSTLLPSLFNGPWYNGKKDIDGYMADRSSWLIGSARLRQLRVKIDTCHVASVFKGFLRDCNEPYSWEAEETTRQFKPGWLTALPNFTTTNRAWEYRRGLELKSLPFLGRLAFYSGGGYAEDLGPTVDEARRKIEELRSENWIDKQTRAVFIEITIYNPHTNMHCVAFFILEVSASGGAFPFVELLVTRIDRYTGNFKLFVLIFELAFVCFIIFFTYKLIKGMLKIGPIYYFKQYWNWVELALVSLSWTAIVLYFVRFTINALTQKEYSKNKNQFVNFHPLAASDQLFGYVYAFVVFLVSLKFLRLFRFNRRMSLLASTLRNASKELIYFSIVFGIVFMAFVHFSYLVFSTDLYMFHTFMSTVETLISVMLGKFSYERLLSTNRVLAPLMFFFYSFLVVWVLINMFISIIIENFQEVKYNNDLQSNEYEIVDFMTDQFRVWLGWSTWGFIFSSKNKVRDYPMGKPTYKKRKRVNQAENLKNRVDRLVSMIQTVYFEKGDFLRNDGEVTYTSRENVLC